MRIVCCIIDALPHRHVTADVTPHLWALARDGGRAERGGLAVMAAATYPNHRSFATGLGPGGHGVLVNAHRHAPTEVPTVFSVCRRSGVSIEAVLGDQELVAVMGAGDADHHWPPHGVLPEGTPVDEYGYPTDSIVLEHLLAALDRDPQVLVAQLNDPDTAAHLHGPDTAAAHERFRATDAVFGQFVAALRPGWDDTVVMVVSDHDQESVTEPEPIDLVADAERDGVRAEVHDEGSAVLVHGDPEVGRWLAHHPDVEGHTSVRHCDGDAWLAWSRPGWWFGRREWAGALRGVHGSPRTQTQAALVGGGHPAADAIAATLRRAVPHASDWAPTITTLLGLDLPGATGRSLA